MKLVTVILTLGVFNLVNAQSGGTSKAQTLIVKHIRKPLQHLKKATQIDFSATSFTCNQIEKYPDGSQLVAKGKIVYNSSCGQQTSDAEIHFEASKNQELSRKSKLIYVEVLQPRCEEGKYTPNSYNLVKIDSEGNKIQL